MYVIETAALILLCCLTRTTSLYSDVEFTIHLKIYWQIIFLKRKDITKKQNF